MKSLLFLLVVVHVPEIQAVIFKAPQSWGVADGRGWVCLGTLKHHKVLGFFSLKVQDLVVVVVVVEHSPSCCNFWLVSRVRRKLILTVFDRFVFFFFHCFYVGMDFWCSLLCLFLLTSPSVYMIP